MESPKEKKDNGGFKIIKCPTCGYCTAYDLIFLKPIPTAENKKWNDGIFELKEITISD